jgi:hypothetical protein
VERRINNNSDGDNDEFSAMWFEQDPKTIFLALWSENVIIMIIIIAIIIMMIQ